MEYSIQNAKQEFLDLASSVQREGADKLLEWLSKTDFFTAPASTKFHSNFEGGLCEHSLKVYKRFVEKLEAEFGENWKDYVSAESAIVIALFHDVCKADVYTVESRNVKEDGVWVQKPYYAYNDKMPYGHGEKSVYIINGFLRLTRLEAMCINWHMGEYDQRVKGGFMLSDVFYMYKEALLFHLADVEATYLDEKKVK